MAGNSWQTKLEARKDLESPAADNQLLPTMEVPAVSNHEKQHSKQMLHKPLNGVNKNSLSSEFNQPTSFDHQISEVSQGEKGKLKGVEPCAHLDEEVKEEVEDCDQNVQTTLNPPRPLHRQLEPANSVCAESILVHPSERPLQSEDESSNVQPTITTTIGGSGFPVTYPPFPQFQHAFAFVNG
nr:hypothetical protein HmN_000307600 [Hymenolepis microstoma]